MLVRRNLLGFLAHLDESSHGLPEFVKVELAGFGVCGDYDQALLAEVAGALAWAVMHDMRRAVNKRHDLGSVEPLYARVHGAVVTRVSRGGPLSSSARPLGPALGCTRTSAGRCAARGPLKVVDTDVPAPVEVKDVGPIHGVGEVLMRMTT